MKIKMTVNGYKKVYDVAPDEYLLDTLRADNLFSIKRGCDNSSCGVCTVLLDDKPVPSCSLLTVKADNKRVTTVEGISKDAERLSEHMGHEGADQCGYCNPSLALTMYAMKLEILAGKKPTEIIKPIFDMLVFNTQNEAEQLLSIYFELYNHFPQWTLKGYSPDELASQKYNSTKPLKRVGRNDPCPCGSGKKYKKCCGE